MITIAFDNKKKRDSLRKVRIWKIEDVADLFEGNSDFAVGDVLAR